MTLHNLSDIFGVIQHDHINPHKVNTKETISNILKNREYDINWTNLVYDFYNEPIKTVDINIDNIKSVLKNSNPYDSFCDINQSFEKLNELNMCYNLKHKKNHTLHNLYNIYLKLLFDDNYKKIQLYWFENIYNDMVNTYDNSKISKYQHSVIIFKRYLNNIEVNNELVEQFINEFIWWSSNKMIEKYRDHVITFDEIITNVLKIYSSSLSYFDEKYRSAIRYNYAVKMLKCLDQYLESIFISETKLNDDIFYIFNSINPTSSTYDEYNYIISGFICRWINKNRQTDKISENINEIIAFIGNFRNNITIINTFKKIYTLVDKNKILNTMFKDINGIVFESEKFNIDCTSLTNIYYIIDFITLYDDHNKIIELYQNSLQYRIEYILKRIVINNDVITNENRIYSYLTNQLNRNSITVENYLKCIQNCITNMDSLKKIETIKMINSQGNQIESLFDRNKCSYIVVDKHIEIDNITIKEPILDNTTIPIEIKQYYNVGKTYYNTAFDIKKIEWDLENSIINFNVNSNTIISNIIQYIIIFYVSKNSYSVQQLINLIANKNSSDHKYLKQYIKNLIDIEILQNNNDKLSINSKYNKKDQHDIIENFRLTDDNINLNIPDNIDIQLPYDYINNNSIIYLRTIFLIKMFKINSTRWFEFKQLKTVFKDFVEKYVLSKPSFEQRVKDTLMNLYNVPDGQLLNELSDIEKRCIIESKDKETDLKFKYYV